jgi:hypothetical protein
MVDRPVYRRERRGAARSRRHACGNRGIRAATADRHERTAARHRADTARARSLRPASSREVEPGDLRTTRHQRSNSKDACRSHPPEARPIRPRPSRDLCIRDRLRGARLVDRGQHRRLGLCPRRSTLVQTDPPRPRRRALCCVRLLASRARATKGRRGMQFNWTVATIPSQSMLAQATRVSTCPLVTFPHEKRGN